MATSFRGWSESALAFYRALEGDNTRTFWAAHKAVYDAEVKAPFEALSDLVAGEFGPLKVFRPHRDVRFTRDKTPYKTRCYAVTQREGGETLYVEFSAKGLVAASGYWLMAGDQLVRYRQAVDDERKGSVLAQTIAELRSGGLDIVGRGLKTAPRGYPRDHPRVELLRHTSLAAMRSFDPAAWLHTEAAARHVIDVWRAAAPLNLWLAQHVGPAKEAAVPG